MMPLNMSTQKIQPLLAVFIFLGTTLLFCQQQAEGFVQRQGQQYHRQHHHHCEDHFALKAVSTDASETWTMDYLDDYAERTGVIISFTTLGPGYRAVARAKHDESLILGYVEGFVRPAGQILHLDKMEIFKTQVQKAKRQVPDSFDFGGISFGVGLVLGYRCLLHAKEKGCEVAEFLAIDDEEFQHKRLVRYYKRVGFQVVKYVGEDLQDVPARMVWGGCGTLMKEEIDVLIQKWAALLTLMDERANSEKS